MRGLTKEWRRSVQWCILPTLTGHETGPCGQHKTGGAGTAISTSLSDRVRVHDR